MAIPRNESSITATRNCIIRRSTEKVYPRNTANDESSNYQGGASITPLEKLLKSKLDAEKILKMKSPRLFTVSTRLPDFKEVVTPIQQLASNEIADWI